MRLSRLIPALTLALLLSLVISSASLASKAEELIQRADKAVAKAVAARSTADKNENYQKALDIYGKVIKQHADTPQAVQALFAEAEIHRSAPGKFRNLRQAYDKYAQLINSYDKSRSELTQTFTGAEADQILAIVDKVKGPNGLKQQVAGQLDKQNSKQFLYKVLDTLVRLTGKKPAFSYWFAIILVTVIVKLAITPLTKAQFKAMKEMQKVAPLIKDIQAKYKGDQKAIGEKTMEVYREHHINPFASCLPILVQMPILWLLYYMIRSYEFQFANGTFLWIGSGLSHLANFAVPFGMGGKIWLTAANLAEPDLVLVLLYVVSMYVSTKLSSVDPTQAEQQKMMAIVMPLMFAFIFAGFPSAFLLYWLVFNILQTTQQYLILHGGQEAAVVTPAAPEKPESEAARRIRRRRRR